MLKAAKPRKMNPHWAAMKEFDENMFEKSVGWRDSITYHKALSMHDREMIMVAMTCLIRFEAGVRDHVRYALIEGVTEEEIYACASLAMLLGGIPAYREGVLWIKDELEKVKREGGV